MSSEASFLNSLSDNECLVNVMMMRKDSMRISTKGKIVEAWDRK